MGINLYGLTTLSFIVCITFVLVFLNLLLAFYQEPGECKLLGRANCYTIQCSYYFLVDEDLAWQWVLIEATTLFGALLISMSRNEKSIEVAWKFLLFEFFWTEFSLYWNHYSKFWNSSAGNY